MFLFKSGGFANPNQTADTIQNAVYRFLADFITLFLLVGNLTVKSRTLFSFNLVLNLNGVALSFGFLFGKERLFFNFGLLRILLLLGDNEVRALQILLTCKLF